MICLDFVNNKNEITKLSILKDLKQNIEHNIFCYSENYLLTQPKNKYISEWKIENKKLKIVEQMIREERQKMKEKNKSKGVLGGDK